MRPKLAVLPLLVAGALALAACGEDGTPSPASGGTTAGGATGTEAAPTTTGAATACSTEKPEQKDVDRSYDQPPSREIDVTKTYRATLVTSCGTIVIALDPQGAPNTVNNFVALARRDFYDGLTFHRVVTDFVIQGGDPNGDGSGGPGYRFPDELPTDGYKVGSVAMANAGPDTNGSQFFIVTGKGGTQLPPSYSRFGRVVRGLDVAKRIEGLEDRPDPSAPGTQRPTQPVYILDVEIAER
jgi:cyclophilin family peptidyl-prolyl cis-trans isomerase